MGFFSRAPFFRGWHPVRENYTPQSSESEWLLTKNKKEKLWIRENNTPQFEKHRQPRKKKEPAEEENPIYSTLNTAYPQSPPGDISYRIALREKLQCHDFAWYHKNVYPGMLDGQIVINVGEVSYDRKRKRDNNEIERYW